MNILIETKVGLLNHNTQFYGKTKIGINGLKYQLCRYLSDRDGSTKSRVEQNGEIFYPDFNSIVLIDENNI